MTDEEMADEYIQNGDVFVNNKVTIKSTRQAFLAGLKAGKDMAEADLATVAYMQGAEQQKKKADKQLTEAKEIIEKLLNAFASNDFFEEEELCAMAEAEQFLKEADR